MAAHLDEASRQRAVDIYRIVDSLPEAAYDDIVHLASLICDTPIALVSLLDRDRQWFKASRGVEGTGTRRDEAFCAHAIETPNVMMEVRDARTDARFVENPFVTGEMSIRFYAGIPLVTEGGAAIGTVCVLDRQPRELDAAQRNGLQALARLTMTLLNARLHEQQLERAMRLSEAVHAEAVPPTIRYTVAIFQIQDLAGHAARLGERTLERQLHDLELRLQQTLAGQGDCINRTSHSADFIAVLHGEDVAAAERRLREGFAEFGARAGMHILSGSAAAQGVSERVEMVYARANEALSQAKDAAIAQTSQAA